MKQVLKVVRWSWKRRLVQFQKIEKNFKTNSAQTWHYLDKSLTKACKKLDKNLTRIWQKSTLRTCWNHDKSWERFYILKIIFSVQKLISNLTNNHDVNLTKIWHTPQKPSKTFLLNICLNKKEKLLQYLNIYKRLLSSTDSNKSFSLISLQ